MWQASKTQYRAKFVSNNAKFAPKQKRTSVADCDACAVFCDFHAKRAVRCVILIDKSLILPTIRGFSRSLPLLL